MGMKIILTKDVPKLGIAGTVQDVAPGYARNYLIPQGMAAVATRGTIKQVEERQAAEAKRIAKQEDELRGLAERISGMRLELHARVGEQGRLFGSITSADIAEQLTAQLGEEIDRRKIDLEEPIRTVGDHEVVVRLVGRLTPKIIVAVSDPDAPVAAAEATEAAADADDASDDDAPTMDISDDTDETG
jgi:large subunit ribosomal protein L9